MPEKIRPIYLSHFSHLLKMAKHHCAECVRNDEDCCSSYHSRFVTLGDAERIAKLTGKKFPAFLTYSELKENDKQTELYTKKPHSYYYDLAVNGKILQIRDGKKGECLFFGKGMCSVYPARSLACRVYPFWFSERGKIIADNNGLDCPIVCGKKSIKENPSADEIRAGIRKIGYTEKELKELLSQLRKEITEYRKNIASFVRKNKLS
jgi:Fe-S-cluster containining protein